MAITDIARNAAPLLESALEDSDVRDRLQAAGQAGRSAIAKARKGRAKRTVLQRAGEAVREAGGAIVALSQVKEKRRRRRPGLLPVALVGGVAAAAVIAVKARPDSSPTGPTVDPVAPVDPLAPVDAGPATSSSTP